MIWVDMFFIVVIYFIMLCLFFGFEFEICYCILGEWLFIFIMVVFNLLDFVGKILVVLLWIGGVFICWFVFVCVWFLFFFLFCVFILVVCLFFVILFGFVFFYCLWVLVMVILVVCL